MQVTKGLKARPLGEPELPNRSPAPLQRSERCGCYSDTNTPMVTEGRRDQTAGPQGLPADKLEIGEALA